MAEILNQRSQLIVNIVTAICASRVDNLNDKWRKICLRLDIAYACTQAEAADDGGSIYYYTVYYKGLAYERVRLTIGKGFERFAVRVDGATGFQGMLIVDFCLRLPSDAFTPKARYPMTVAQLCAILQ